MCKDTAATEMCAHCGHAADVVNDVAGGAVVDRQVERGVASQVPT